MMSINDNYIKYSKYIKTSTYIYLYTTNYIYMSKYYYILSNIEEFKEYVQFPKLMDNNSNTKSTGERLFFIKKDNYIVIKYNKNVLSKFHTNSYGLLRSVILDNDRVCCFSPPKSTSSDSFISQYPISNSQKDAHIVAEEFVEGTMINVFYSHSNNQWEIATKSNVGGNTSFYKNSKTFREMFEEACTACHLSIDTLNRTFCYSFVLQHPANRIVVPFNKPQLYLTDVYSIVQDSSDVLVYPVSPHKIYDWSMTGVMFPKTYEFTSYSELIETYASPNTPYNIMGVVLRNTETLERCKIRNPIYEEVRHLKGNQSKLQYQYLYLRHTGKIPEFLKYYPENKGDFSKYRDHVHMFTITLYQNYISCYIKKERPLKEFGAQYRTHMYKLHQHYINDLRERNLYITSGEVIRYVNSLHPSLLMYCLNYNMRKQNIDESVVVSV